MTELFPSIVPDDDTYSATELNGWDYPVIRAVISAHNTDDVNGKSTKLEMAAWLSGRYDTDTLDRMQAKAQELAPKDEADYSEILEEAEGLGPWQ
jgi:predicted 2-oxoglutarate/Fe(II)-dependent dioxygenase YbiX